MPDLGELAVPSARYRVLHEDGSQCEGLLDDHGRLPPLRHAGYCQLHVGDRQLTLAVAPPVCPSVEQLCGKRRAWGLTTQLYSLRRELDGGLGDLAALEDLVKGAARHGTDAVAISPMHSMFPAARGIYSPYSPSSRLFFNELYASPALVLGDSAVRQAIDTLGLAGEFARLEALSLLDWVAAARLRDRLLLQLHADFQHQPLALREDFQAFRSVGGEALQQHCCFQVLQMRRLAAGDGLDWRFWPSAFRRPDAQALRQFTLAEEAEIDLQAFAQWLAVRSLQHAQRTALGAGMGIGLIADLAVGAEPAGSQAWMRQEELLAGVSIGAPPDILHRGGQNWGICAFSPEGLRRHGFRAFIEMLRANLRFVGGLRIDHVLGLRRLWVIPSGAPAEAGAYLDYPFEDLLRLICLEAQRGNALIIGEDLGTVPAGLREALAERGVLGMRVLLFEQQHGHFVAPQRWSDDALATTTTHDLPTLRGWCEGRDMDWRERIDHRLPGSDRQQRESRQHEVQALKRALGEQAIQGDLPDAAIEFVGRTPAPLVLLPLEDALGSLEQPNLPGPGDTHPNWRQRCPTPATEILESPAVAQRLRRLQQARNGGTGDE
ncbi:4-alpha-glucanotransferase [compost metagenome]